MGIHCNWQIKKICYTYIGRRLQRDIEKNEKIARMTDCMVVLNERPLSMGRFTARTAGVLSHHFEDKIQKGLVQGISTFEKVNHKSHSVFKQQHVEQFEISVDCILMFE